MIEEAAESFETVYNGRNYVGKFDDDADDVFFEITMKLEDVPTHDIRCVGNMSVREYFDDIPKTLKSAGIDIVMADFDDYETLNKAIDALEAEIDSMDRLFNVDYEEDLKELQEELKDLEGEE